MRLQLKHAALALLGLITAGLLSIGGSIGPHIGPRIGSTVGPRIGVGPSLTRAIVIIGDSNGVGQGVTDKSDPAFSITTTITGVPYEAQYSQAASDPITWTNLAAGGVRPYAIGGVAGFGAEMALAQSFLAAGQTPVIIKIAVSGTSCTQWLTGSGYPGSGGELYAQARTYIRAQAAAHGAVVAGFAIFIGGNDGTNSTDANNLQAHLATLSTQLHADFGPVPLILVKSNDNTDVTFLSTVRSAQVAAAAADTSISLIDNDDLTLVSDRLHFNAEAYITLGQRIAYTLLTRLGVPAVRPSTVPDLVGFGPQTYGPGTGEPAGWGGAIAGDIEVLVDMSLTASGVNNAITTPTGWTLISNTSTTATDGTSTTRVAAYSRVVDSTMLTANGGHTAATSIAAANSINGARIFTIRGASAIDTALASSNAGFTTSLTLSQITPSVPGLALMVVGGFRTNASANQATITAAGLTSLADREEATRDNGDSNFVTIAAWTGRTAGVATGSAATTFALNTLAVGEFIGAKP